MNTQAPFSNASVERRPTNRRNGGPGIPADEREHLIRVGRLVIPALRQMRNPLSALLATSELLDERMTADDPNRGFVRLIRQETARVQEGLSDLSAIAEPMPLNPVVINLPQLVKDALDAHRLYAARRGIRLTQTDDEPDLRIRTDRSALRLALDKLLKHAIEAMSYGGVLHAATAQARDALGPMAQLLVTDEGPCVPPELLAGLFQPFAVSPGRSPGMRLALCRMIVERLGGRMNAWNNEEAGLTVEVRLPLS